MVLLSMCKIMCLPHFVMSQMDRTRRIGSTRTGSEQKTVKIVIQHSLDCPYLKMTKVEMSRVIWIDIINLENKITWISPKFLIGKKMAHYKTQFLHSLY